MGWKIQLRPLSRLFLLLTAIGIVFLSSNRFLTDTFKEKETSYSFFDNVQLKMNFNEESAVLNWPCIVCDSNNNVYVSWEKNTIKDNYGNSDEIFLQKFSSNGTAIGSKILLVNRSDISNSTIALSHSTLKIDSNDNFHLFFYVMEYTSPQIGHVYYRSFNSNFDILVDYKIIITYQQAGWGTSAFNEMITTVILDENDLIHLLCCEEYYIHLDNNGIIIDSINLKEDNNIHTPSMTVDSKGNIFIVWEEDYRKILFRSLRIENNTITSVASKILDSHENVLYPIILMKEGDFFVSWNYIPEFDYENSQTMYRQLNNLGETINDEKLGFNNLGVDFLSKNKSLIYTIHPTGYSCGREDLKFYYSLRSFRGDILVQNKGILIIPSNPESDHGPAIFSLRGFEDKFGFLWLAWYMNDYNYGYQVLLWKLDSNACPIFPLTVVTPSIREYEGALYNFTTPTSEKPSNSTSPKTVQTSTSIMNYSTKNSARSESSTNLTSFPSIYSLFPFIIIIILILQKKNSKM